MSEIEESACCPGCGAPAVLAEPWRIRYQCGSQHDCGARVESIECVVRQRDQLREAIARSQTADGERRYCSYCQSWHAVAGDEPSSIASPAAEGSQT